MEVVAQLSVFLANKPGTLAAVLKALSEADINVYGLTISDTVDHAVVRMVVSDPDEATDIFEQRGVLVVENKVLMMDNDNKPGSFAKIAAKLAKAGINIDYAYLATSPGASKGLLIIRPSDVKKAAQLLAKH